MEAPSPFGFLLFADNPLTVCPLPPHGVPFLNGEHFASWMPDTALPNGLPRVPVAAIRWAIRGDVIDISFFTRRDQMREVFAAADAAGNFLRPRDLVHRDLLIERGEKPEAVDATVALLPETVRWMDTYTIETETPLIEWERIQLSASEDFTVVASERSRLAKSDTSNAMWLAGGILPSVWTMMKAEKVAKTGRARVTRQAKSAGGSRVTTLVDDVSIIDVRPYEYRPHTETGTGRKITVRFLVKGHMSTYWTGPGRKVPRRRFVAPYWKGDPSMPVKGAERVNVLR